MGFFTVLLRVCFIPDSFVFVVNQTFRRTLFHFILFVLLLSLGLTLVHASMVNRQIRNACTSVMEQTGDFILSPEKGFQTEKDAAKVKRFLLNSSLSVDFYPGKSLKKDALKELQTPFGLIFMDKGLVFWAENYGNMGKGRFLIAPMKLAMNSAAANKIQMDVSAADAEQFLRNEFILEPGEKSGIVSARFNTAGLTGQLTALCSIMIFLMVLLAVLISAVGTVLFYSLAQYLWFNGAMQRILTYKQILVVLMYGAFAPLICGGLVSLLPDFFLAPQTVFLIAFFIYSFVILRKLRRQLAEADSHYLPPEDEENEDK